MSRKRICEDCGNKCNDEYCPICGRKTKVYNEASRQEDTLYDAAKYRTTADTDIRIMSISREGGRRKISVWFSCSACC